MCLGDVGGGVDVACAAAEWTLAGAALGAGADEIGVVRGEGKEDAEHFFGVAGGAIFHGDIICCLSMSRMMSSGGAIFHGLAPMGRFFMV